MNVQFLENYVGLHTGGVKYVAGDVIEVGEHAGHALVHRLGVAVKTADDAELTERPITPRPLPSEPQQVTKSWKPEISGHGKAKR